ncbi:Hypothetical predicted protein [Olea europaea subsp. europaea]|uniref:Uncharacterized protein n=1 Tax=Olea europaea subsp. europaea TaxID=158383 RepID=A0A8S0QNB5_OLEEU|nr:Hypothetical predicted protein [Olea europaea subsp. europaea]
MNDGLPRNQLVIRGLLWHSEDLNKGILLASFCLRDNWSITNCSSVKLMTTMSSGGSSSSPWSCTWWWELSVCWRSTHMGAPGAKKRSKIVDGAISTCVSLGTLPNAKFVICDWGEGFLTRAKDSPWVFRHFGDNGSVKSVEFYAESAIITASVCVHFGTTSNAIFWPNWWSLPRF